MGSTCQTNHCLFCACVTTADSEWEALKCLGEGDIKEEEADDIANEVPGGSFPVTFSDTRRLIREQLGVIFIVRKLLDLPVERCADYLKRNFGDEQPSSWFRVCADCGNVVEEGYKVYCDIRRLEGKLGKIKRGLKNLVLVNQKRKRRSGKNGQNECVYFDVRDYVVSENQANDSVMSQTTYRKSSARKRKVTTKNDFCSSGGLENVTEPYHDDDPVASPDPLHEDDDNDADWQPIPSDEADVKREVTPPNKRRQQYVKKNRKQKVSRKQFPLASDPQINEAVVDEDIITSEEANDESLETTSTKMKVRVSYLIRCDLCVAVYKTYDQLKTHQELHENNQGKPCPYCGWVCKKKTLSNHFGKHHPSMRSRKNILRRPPLKIRKLKCQYKRVVQEGIPYYCDHCHMIYASKLRLLQHIRLHHAHFPSISCEICKVSGFETKQILEFHCKEVHQSEGTHQSEQEEPQNCTYCSKSFPTKLKMDYHIAKFHVDKLLTCKICGIATTKYSVYLEHYNLKHEKRKRYMCEMCPSSFSSIHYLKCHMNMKHHEQLGVEPLICKDCNVTFPYENMLQQHIEFVHKKVKPHCCEFCGKAFARVCDMRKHILLHTEPREKQYKQGPFFCEFCQAKFNVRQGLYYHLKKQHSDKYAFKCGNCGTGYTTDNTLAQHLRKCKGKISSPLVTATVDKGVVQDQDMNFPTESFATEDPVGTSS